MSTPYPPRGFAPVPRDPSELKPVNGTSPPALTLADIPKPDTPLVRAALEFVTQELPPEILNHSQRAYCIGYALVKSQFPDWEANFDPEAFYLTTLFHDIGCTPKNLTATYLSFEYFGAIISRDWLLKAKAKQSLVDNVAEAIFRHTNFVGGRITTHGQVIQLATKLDILGWHSEWINPKTYQAIVEAHPRLGWSGCFGHVMDKEIEVKPWSHTTTFEGEGYADNIRKNPFAKPLEEKEKAHLKPTWNERPDFKIADMIQTD